MPDPTELEIHGGEFVSRAPNTIFTPEQFDADERLMIETAEAFSRKEILPHLEAIDRQEEGLMPSLIRKAGELGLCGVDSPEAYGGLGLSKNLAARILEFMSLNGSFSVTYGITSGISQVGLALFGTEAQKAEYLPRLASGEWIGAYALSEPNSGSDALSITTRADRRDDTYVLNGTKMWISNAKWADLFLVMAKVDGEHFSAFLVERDTPGLTVAREEHKMGLKGSSTARVLLENVEIPARNLLHQEGLGHHVAFNALNIGRFKLSSMSLGPCRHAMEIARAYAHERRQFGQPIANAGLIQQKFAMMEALFFAAESMIYRTGALIDQAFAAYGGTVDGNRKAAEEFAIECSICKVFTTEIQAHIVDECLQVFGGYGFTEEFPIARHYRDARVSRIYEGTNEINRLFIGSRYIQRRAQGRLDGAPRQDSFVSDLIGRLPNLEVKDQVHLGTLADLLTLDYADQSVRLRTQSRGYAYSEICRLIGEWASFYAAQAFRRASGEPIVIPAT